MAAAAAAAAAPAPRLPANQGQWGECTLFAMTKVVSELLQEKYHDFTVDDDLLRGLLIMEAQKLPGNVSQNGVWPDKIATMIHTLGVHFKLRTVAPEAGWCQIRFDKPFAKVTSFDALAGTLCGFVCLSPFLVHAHWHPRIH
jgi:hypothetical protein